MNRRNFLKYSSSASLSSLIPSLGWTQSMNDYSGDFYITIQALGGWDVTSFCDPKLNLPNQPIVNNWAANELIQYAGNLAYAPFASNQAFFDKYKNYMLVINGVDTQTNSHDAGLIHTFSGRLAAGYPSLSALLAHTQSTPMPIAWINNGGYSDSIGLANFSRLMSVSRLKAIASPGTHPRRDPAEWGNKANWITPEIWDSIKLTQQDVLDEQMSDPMRLPGQIKNRRQFSRSRLNARSLERFSDDLPDNLDVESVGLKRQAQIALLAFKSEVAFTADLVVYGFDTHGNHDNLHAIELTKLAEAIDYLWETAEALGIADRLNVMIASEFGRTPYYNYGGGKDHWPITSSVFMKKNSPWGNRVVGATDDKHQALKINPATLQLDDSGILIHPKHVMQAARQLVGIESHSVSQRFEFADLIPIDFFNQDISTIIS